MIADPMERAIHADGEIPDLTYMKTYGHGIS